MCCIFNFLQYLFAFLHKAVTAALCCILACAVCCVLLFAVTAGVALGYNYSVSEYMEHKDTNVSVQLQRGIFTEKGGSAAARRRSGGDEGGEIGEEMDSAYTNPKSSLRSHMQQLDAAENYERKLDELTSENYQNFQPIINYGTVNLDQQSTHQPHISIESTRANWAGFTGESPTENLASKKESIELMRTLIERLKGDPGKDVMTIIGEEVAKKAFDHMKQNVSNYRMPIEVAMAGTSSSTTEEFEMGLDIAPLDIEIKSSSRSTKVLLFSEFTTPASVASSASDIPASDTEDISSDWKKKLYDAVARMKRKGIENKTHTKNKRNTKTKDTFMMSLFQDPSFITGIKSIPLVPYPVSQKKTNEQNAGFTGHKLKRNGEKDILTYLNNEKDELLKSQSGVNIHKKVESSTSHHPEVNYSDADLHDDDGPAPSDEEYDEGEDEKPSKITVRKKRSAPPLIAKHFNKSRIMKSLINAIS